MTAMTATILMTILKTIGASLGSLLVALLTGKTFKDLLLRPIRWISSKTATPEDDKIVKDIETDWGVETPVPPEKDGEKAP